MINEDEFIEFHRWVKRKYPMRDYGKASAEYTGSPKFTKVFERVKRLLPIAILAEWDKKQKLHTLDIGCGPGHMGLVANFFGHNCLGIDNNKGIELFSPLREFWKQPVLCCDMDMEGLPSDIGKFNTITSILTNYGRYWSAQKWGQFVDNILENHLEPNGLFILNFPGDKSLNYRMYLLNRAWYVKNGTMFFNHTIKGDKI